MFEGRRVGMVGIDRARSHVAIIILLMALNTLFLP
jgi:hypothetical protein